MRKGFRSWAKTHHEIVERVTLIMDSKCDDEWPTKIRETMDEDGMEGFYTLCIDLTNQFENEYECETWEVGWFAIFNEFLEKNLS